jgi:hypothetical protein
MSWITANIETVLAIFGGLFMTLRAVVLLTPTPKDDKYFKKVYGIYGTVLGVLSKVFGVDTTQGVQKAQTPTIPLSMVVFLVPAFLITTTFSGCNVFKPLDDTEASRLLTAQKTFTATLRGVTLMAEDDKLNEGAIARIDILVEQIDGYLLEWEAAVTSGGSAPGIGDMVIQLIAELGKYQFANL